MDELELCLPADLPSAVEPSFAHIPELPEGGPLELSDINSDMHTTADRVTTALAAAPVLLVPTTPEGTAGAATAVAPPSILQIESPCGLEREAYYWPLTPKVRFLTRAAGAAVERVAVGWLSCPVTLLYTVLRLAVATLAAASLCCDCWYLSLGAPRGKST